jgi:ribosomal protein L37AE/L43A
MGFFSSKVRKEIEKEQQFQNIPLQCPRCHILMKKIQRKGITIDYCPQCNGMWLDHEEADKLTKF